MSEAAAPTALRPEQLRLRCDPATLDFETTAELPPLMGLAGQPRAAEALAFGIGTAQSGFNVFVAGEPGTGKSTAVRALLAEVARGRPTPGDWCYVHNFQDASRPRALRLAPGEGRRLVDALRDLVGDARREIPRVFESEEYIAAREQGMNALNRRRQELFARIGARGEELGFAIQFTSSGVAAVPILNGRPASDEDIASLTEEARAAIRTRREELDGDIRLFFRDMRAIDRDGRTEAEQQDRQVALNAVGGLVDEAAELFPGNVEVLAYLEQVRDGILADVPLFRSRPMAGDGALPEPNADGNPERIASDRAFRKYQVNLIVDNSATRGAPVVAEPNPTLPNLVGRVEREALFGALMTDFTLIDAGALHRANGGYLVLRVLDVLRAPLAWDALKRALREGAIAMEDANEALGIGTTRGLRPEPIPLSVKVVLIGEAQHYRLLHAYDPDFRELFRVRADFDSAMDRTTEHEAAYAAVLGGYAGRRGAALHRGAVARIIEEAARIAGDQRKLCACFGTVVQIVDEAQHVALLDGAPIVSADHVSRAVAQRRERAAQLPERYRELVARGILLVQPRGSALGQIHGLSVIDLGDMAFGHPTRITATIGVGREGIVDIERQVELGGPIHSKGVLILGGYLTGMYTREKPLSLSARIVFEQSYSGVEGDSASLAELLTLLSLLADAPLRQDLAVTGSVNQRGEVQAVGGLNEKIEGFYDACQALGLTGAQGVVLPAANVQHLMLREDVVAAVAAGQFHVHAVATVDEAIGLLTGLPAGARDGEGRFPAESLHGRADARVRTLGEALRAFGAGEEGRGRSGRRGSRVKP